MVLMGLTNRLDRESRTVAAMVRLYCRDHHGRDRALCEDCSRLMAYADSRLEKCPFEEGKPTCADCTIHCYRAEMREEVRVVMRYAGPRMTLRHPILAFLHLFDSRRKAPLC